MAAARPAISWPDLRGARPGCGASASRAWRACASWPSSARTRCWWTTARRAGPGRAPVLATGDGGLERWPAARS